MKRIILSALLLLAAVALGAQTEPVKFAFLSDVHLCSDSPRIDNLNKCIDDINADESIQFSIFGGDITEFGADHEIALAKSVIDRLKKPYYIVAGNHDAKWSESGCNTFARIFGYESFEFEAGGVKFIGCNSGPNMRMAPALMPHESLVWLDSIAKAIPHEQPVIFVNHYPQDSSMLNYFQVMNTLKQCNIQLLLGGHWHKNTILEYQGVPGILGRAPDRGREIGYNIMTIKDGKFEAVERVLIDKEGKEVFETRKPWYTQEFSNEPLYKPDEFDKAANPYGLPADFPWLKFDINDEYPQVKSVWANQDESDIGGGATYAGKLVVYANTQGVVKAIDSRDGSPRWSFATEGKVFSTPAVAKKRVIIGSTDGYIYCLNLRNGRLRWKHKCDKSVLASPAILGKVAYVGSSDGCFRALNIRSGKLVWQFDGVKGFVECRPYVDETQVVFGDWANTLYSLDTRSGELQWEWSTKGSRMLSTC
jgi:FOG: WD40-like repeat